MNRRSKPVAQKELEEQIGRALCSRAESIQGLPQIQRECGALFTGK